MTSGVLRLTAKPSALCSASAIEVAGPFTPGDASLDAASAAADAHRRLRDGGGPSVPEASLFLFFVFFRLLVDFGMVFGDFGSGFRGWFLHFDGF